MIIKDLFLKGQQELADCSLTPELDTMVLLGSSFRLEKAKLLAEWLRTVNSEETALFDSLLARRVNGEPIAYITGKKEFYSLTFHVNRNVFIPRPETELLVEKVDDWLDLNEIRCPKIIDLGTGSGALAVTLAKIYPLSLVWAVDLSEKALEAARKNACLHGVSNRITFVRGDFFEPLAGVKANVVVSNPPYVEEADFDQLGIGVRNYEPKEAFIAPEKGLAYLKKIAEQAGDFLLQGGCLAMEIGYNQGDYMSSYLSAFFSKSYLIKDYGSFDRIVWGEEPKL